MTQQMTATDARPVTIGILGAGAVGQLICHQLHCAGLSVGLISRNLDVLTGLEAVNWQMLDFQPIDASQSATLEASDTYQVPLLRAEPTALASLQLLIVCVKAYQASEALSPLLPKLPEQCHILLLHNGMGPHLAIAPQLKGRGLSLGTTSQGVLRQAQWRVKQTGQGLTQFGHFTGPQLDNALCHALLKAIPNSEWVEAIIPCLWQKLAVNATINPLTAIHQCPNGTLVQTEFTQTIANILEELIEVAALDGITLDRAKLTERVYRVIELTSTNFSSMHQDVAHNRHTEIAQINGYICERAAANNTTAPINAKLCEQVNQLTAQLKP